MNPLEIFSIWSPQQGAGAAILYYGIYRKLITSDIFWQVTLFRRKTCSQLGRSEAAYIFVKFRRLKHQAAAREHLGSKFVAKSAIRWPKSWQDYCLKQNYLQYNLAFWCIPLPIIAFWNESTDALLSWSTSKGFQRFHDSFWKFPTPLQPLFIGF